jgi:hypothetical protein
MKKNLRLFLFFCVTLTFQALAQEKAITGKVIGDDGTSLPGVAVTIKGTTKGTNTDADGNFRISVSSNASLVFSYVGYKSEEVAVGNQTSLKISLETSSETLNEVVVTTFGTAKKTSFTGSAATIGADKIGPRPITNIGQALAGVSAGVQATAGSGRSARHCSCYKDQRFWLYFFFKRPTLCC